MSISQSFFKLTRNKDVVFYPWGFPGEGYFLDNKIQSKTETFCLLFLFCFFSYYALMIFALLLKIFTFSLFQFTILGLFMIFPFVYIGYVRLFIINEKPKKLPYSLIKRRFNKPVIFIYVLLVLPIILELLANITYLRFAGLNGAFNVMGSAYIVAITLFIKRLCDTNGFIFEEANTKDQHINQIAKEVF